MPVAGDTKKPRSLSLSCYHLDGLIATSQGKLYSSVVCAVLGMCIRLLWQQQEGGGGGTPLEWGKLSGGLPIFSSSSRLFLNKYLQMLGQTIWNCYYQSVKDG